MVGSDRLLLACRDFHSLFLIHPISDQVNARSHPVRDRVRLVAGTESRDPDFQDSEIEKGAAFGSVSGVCVSVERSMAIVSDWTNHRLRRVDLTDQFIP